MIVVLFVTNKLLHVPLVAVKFKDLIVLLLLMSPFTSNLYPGLLLLIPTFPLVAKNS